VRRFLRPIVIAVATLGLALGAGVGLAAPAFADNALTGGVDYPDSGLIVAGTPTTLTFSGTKDSTSTVTQFQINNPATDTVTASSGCVVPSDGLSWSCSYATSGFNTANGSTIEVDYTNSDGAPSQTLITFDVVPSVDSSPVPTPYVAPTYTPGHDPGTGKAQMTVTPTPSSDAGATLGETQFYKYSPGGAGFESPSDAGCPGPLDETFPVSEGEPPTCPILLDPAIWLAESQQAAPGDGGDYILGSPVETVFEVQAAPSARDPVFVKNSDRSVTIAGTVPGNPTGNVLVFDQSGAKVCTVAIVPVAGRTNAPASSPWSCNLGVLSVGSHMYFAAAQDQGSLAARDVANTFGAYYLTGALSDLVTMGTVVVTAPTVPGGGSGDTTPNWSFTIGGDLTDVHPGDILTISGTGLPAGTSLDTILHSVPTDLGTVVAAADGTFSQTATVPADVELGAHTIEVTASGPGIVTTTKQQPITVTALPAASSGSSGKTSVDTTKPTATHGNGENGGGSGLAPNILTKALTPFADIAVHPNKIVSAFEIGLVLLLLAVLPAHLLNATIAEQSDRFERRFGKAKMPSWLRRLGAWFKSTPVVGGIIVTVATAVLFGFADPKFGFTLASLRLILACGIALFFVGYVANALTGLIARVQWNVIAAVSTRPYGLILTVVGVVVSRALHFSPGFLIGLILGLTIQERSAATYAWRTIVLRTSIVLTMAIAAWIGYSTLTLGGNEGGTFGLALLVETLVAITTEGVVALLVELLPLRFLEGQRVYDHSRVLWGIFYFLTLVVFVLAVVPWEGNWDALHGSLWIWIVVLAAFAAVCVGVYIYFRRFSPPVESDDEDEEVPLGETVSRDHK
jgi:hypothetical protein